MATYYFHVRVGTAYIEDLEGIDLPSIDAAEAEAVNAARDMVSERVRSGHSIANHTIDIVESGVVLRTVSFESVVRRD